MSITKTVHLSGVPVTFRASAAIPRLYRAKFQRDVYKDITNLWEQIIEEDKEPDTTLVEDIAYIMARHGDPEGTPESVEEWLAQFDTFSVFEMLPHIIEMWHANTATTVTSKKDSAGPNGK